ncbi:MAG: MATE family efflux transporter [Oscillospiraceae bacterium]|nr:MATE family efflux transporter [Oscillospiraceae bacterium]
MSAELTQEPRENKMGTMPVGRLLFSMSLPMVLSMLIQALYNVVDSIFVAQISENALTAVSLAFPFQNLMIAIAVGTGVGVNALLSRSLGEKRVELANKAAENGIFLTLISCLLFMVLGTALVQPFYLAQAADEAAATEIITLGTGYLSLCSLLCAGLFLEIMMERLLQSTGRTFYTMITQGTGAVINIVLDPILIFGLFGFPRLGVNGAAVATVAGQFVAAALAILFNLKCNPDIHPRLRTFRPDGAIIRQIYTVGAPSIVMNSIGSVMTFGLNKILFSFTSTATAVLGIYFKFQSFVFMPIFGLNNGMVPIVAYNYGAQKKKRMLDTVRLSVFTAIGIMLLGLLCIQCFAPQILLLFKASDDMLAIGVPALKTVSLSFIFAGYCIIVSSMFQALGNGLLSMTISILRQLVVLLPAAWLLSLSGEVSLVWWAFPIAEIFSVVLCTVFLCYIYRKVIQPMGTDPAL